MKNDEETPAIEPEPEPVHHPEDDDDGKKPVEVWAQENDLDLLSYDPEGKKAPRQNPHYWKFTAARALKSWQPGQLITEEQFDEAIAAVSSPINR